MPALVLPPPGSLEQEEARAEGTTLGLVPVEALRQRRRWKQREARIPKPLTAAERKHLEADMAELRAEFAARPRRGNGQSGDCPTGPCPWMACPHHLKFDINPYNGAMRDNHPGKDFDEMEETCSLRVADTVTDEPLTQQEVGRHMGLSWMRVSQIEQAMLRRLRRASRGFRGRRPGDTME